ncbi:MAG: hypothetical protein ABL934_08780 [Lysobacteraceae bacterium]
MPSLTGICRFAPPLDSAGGRTRRDGSTTDWWLILHCDPDIGRYLRHLYALDTHRTRKLSDPLWGAHVSIVQNEIPPDPTRWKALEGWTMAFEYRLPPQEIDEYVFFPVDCAEALDYREALGLPREPQWPLHLTFGNRKAAR